MGVRVDINSELFSFVENCFPPPSLEEQEEGRTRWGCPVPAGLPVTRSSFHRKARVCWSLSRAPWCNPQQANHARTAARSTACGKQNPDNTSAKTGGRVSRIQKWAGSGMQSPLSLELFISDKPSLRIRDLKVRNEIWSRMKCYPLRIM